MKLLKPVAKELDCTLAQLALAWCLKKTNVNTVITGASAPEQVTENMKAIETLQKLDTDAMSRVERVVQSKPTSEEE